MMGFKQGYTQLNAAQKQAVDAIDGPLLVIAGPGTGKTQLLSLRVANILDKTDADPQNILCLTFTEAAARNMRERLSGLIGEAAFHVPIHTFHSFGTDIIQRYNEYFMAQPLLKPIDELGAYELLSSIFASLPASNPLHITVNGEFLHLRSTQTTISWLKQAGIKPDELRKNLNANKEFIDFANTLLTPVFIERPSPKLLSSYNKLLNNLQNFNPKKDDASLRDLLVAELADAIEVTDPSGRYAKAITAWRNKWLVQNQVKKWIMSDQRRIKMLQAVAIVYERFQKTLEERGWYTFDDMILRTIHALETNEELRLTLQEQYQYILVDEYQDTNGAQNKLLELLASNPVHEDRPNLMVVGDDDQAIYRFQGAHLSIMSDFVERWRDVTQVVLKENYRSNQRLLALARHIITQGESRLENSLPNISKELVAARKDTEPSIITRPQTLSEIDQYDYVANTIAQLIKKGSLPQSIAVLAPKHSYLQALVPYLLDKKIPVSYERREHILEQPRVVELINLARLIDSAAEGEWSEVNADLSIVLAGEYWQLEPLTLWQLSIDAYKDKKLWLDIMAKHPDKTIRMFTEALPKLSQLAKTQPLEVMLDLLLGNTTLKLDDTQWRVPYKQTYFNEEQLARDPVAYFTLLGQLTTLREKIREYRPGEQLTLHDFVQFIDLYQQSNLSLLDTNPHAITDNAIELMTAYKAKGLEWDTVFVLGCHNDVWGTAARSSNNSFSLPHNLSWIKPARDSHDDRLRLFYVALTRAKQNLYLTCYKQSLKGKATSPVSWLLDNHAVVPAIEEVKKPSIAELVHSQELHWGLSVHEKADLQNTLKPMLERYQLSATHLNSFLDLTKGGPKHFFFTHLLHFPERLAPSAVFGSAMHQTLHYMHTQVNAHKLLPSLSSLKEVLDRQLSNAPFPPQEIEHLIGRGNEALSYFYKQMGKTLLPSDRSEYDFAHEGSRIGDVRLSGRVDVLRPDSEGELEIIDYKTGSPFHSWKPKGAYPQIRAHLYQLQLHFYKLLLDTSSTFSGKRSSSRACIQFIESDEEGNLPHLEYVYEDEEIERTKKLITAIWQHIMELNFPDTSAYSLDLKGIKQFENDLIDGQI